MRTRIINAIKIGYWAFLNPMVMNESNFKMLSSLLVHILKVARDRRPYISHIGIVLPNGEKENIVSLWAGSGIGAEPMKRISELVEENELLRKELKRLTHENNA